LDKEMEKRGLRYVRYADDFSIYTKSKSSARKTGNEIYLFLILLLDFKSRCFCSIGLYLFSGFYAG
jgi:hypothetical protein